MNIQDKIMLRQSSNKIILEHISEYLEKYPDMRFIQALQNLGIIDKKGTDRFYEESIDTLNIIEQ